MSTRFVAVEWFKRYQDIIVPLGAGILAVVAGIKIWSAVTKTMAAIQAALNIVLAANPIGLVVLAIAALIAIVVVAYKKNETFRKIVDAVWAGIKKAISATVDWFRNTAWPWMKDVLDKISAKGKWLWDLYKAYWTGIFTAIKTVVSWITGTMWPAIRRAFDDLAAKAKWLWNNGIKPAFDLIKAGASLVVSSFKTMASNVKAAWDKIQGYAKAPVKFVIQTVLNNGLIKGFNWLSDKIGGPHVKNIPLPFATGGVLPGYTPGRDVHRFHSMTGGTLDLSGGEAIMRPEWTRAVGGPAAVARMNADAIAGNVRGFAGGGVVDWIKGKASSAFGWVRDKASDVYKKITNPLDFLRNSMPKVPGSSTLSAMAEAAGSKLLGSAVSKVKGLWKTFRDGYDTVGAGIGSDARGWRELWSIAHRLLPGIQLTSAYRPGAITATGVPSLHGAGRAIDLAPPSMAAFNTLLKAFPNATQLLYSPADGRTLNNGRPYHMSAITKAGHWDHIHLAMANGGTVPVFDNGGIVPPGLSMIDNQTGRPEHLANVTDGRGGDIHVHLDVADLKALRTVEDFVSMVDVRSRMNAGVR